MVGWLGLRSRLVLLVLLALFPVFGLFAYSAAKNQQAAITQAQASLQAEALRVAAQQRQLVDRVAELLGDIASSASIRGERYPECMRYLENLHSLDESYVNLGIGSLDGKISCSALGTELNGHMGDRTYFKRVLATQKFSVGEYGVGRVTGQPGIAFGMPVYSGGAFTGVAFAVLKIGLLQEALGAGKVVEGAQLRVLDRRGVVLATYPPNSSLLGATEQDAAFLQAAQVRQPGGREAVDSGGVGRIYAYAPVDGAANGELFVAMSVARQVSEVGARGLLQGDLATLLGLTAFGMACAWAMGKRLIVNPAHKILREANEIARGNLAARVNLDRQAEDEMGLIGLAFNRMAESLQAQRKELDAALRHADEERSLLDLILNSMSEGVIAIDTAGRFLSVNASAGMHYSAVLQGCLSIDDLRLKHEIFLLDGETPYPLSARPLVQALRGINVDNRELMVRWPGAGDKILRMSARPLYDPQRRLIGALAVFNDITEIKAAEIFAEAQQQVLTLIAGGAPLARSLDAVVRLIENSCPGSLCSILLAEAGQLRHGSAPSLAPDFVSALGALPIAEGVGASGTAAFRRQTVVVADVAEDPLMRDYRELLLAHGLRACWSTPVLSSDGEALAAFAIYRQAPGEPQARELELIATAARLASLALTRTRAEAALTAGEARFREMAENIEDLFYNFDSRTDQVLYVSPGYEKIWGRSCASFYADPPSYAYPVVAEDLHLLTKARQDNRAGKSTDIEFRLLHPDGQMRWIRNRSYPVRNAAGQIERGVGTARDTTDRKRAELALAATNRALQMLSRSSIAINRIDDEPALLTEVCRLAVDVGGYRMAWAGYARDDEEKSIEPMAHAGEESGYLATIRLSWRDDEPGGQGPAGQAIRSAQPQQSSDIGKADNHFYWHETAVRHGYRSAIFLPLIREQRSFGVLCLYAGEVQQFSGEEVKLLQELADNLAFGIGSLRAREEILRLNTTLEERVRQRTAQLEFANQQLEAFSYSVSHDLRSPLSAINGFSNLLEKAVDKPGVAPLSERGRHCLARIKAGVGQMGELIDALLALAQVSRSSLRSEPVDLSALAGALLAGFQEREPARAVRLRVDEGLKAWGDARLLRQVLDNLLANAWKFTGAKACTEITVGSEKGGAGEIVYFVRDNGAGFDMAYVEKLFGAFQRLHSQAEFAGTGIGLATVQRIIARHEGRVWADSAPGQGATFYFTLGARGT